MHSMDSNLKGSLGKLSMASTSSSSSNKDYGPIVGVPQIVGGGGGGGIGRRLSPWGVSSGMNRNRSREGSPGSFDNISMDELDMNECAEEILL